MFLNSIELFGFKSFVERNTIEFKDGVTAILGPNGCGKSNVVDAIKWVLGEQSSHTLRAERMEDVIFNGTENRKSLGVAEVTLVLRDEENVLALELPEVAIKRRVYRSGESEYFINNTPVRLKEIRELFFDTGIGKSAYSIMEQGKIDQILSHKPEERRMIFEEAAGITKYKVRGAEAERKLEKTEENLRQVENIVSEVKRSHDSLKIQADKAGKYRQLKEDIFQVELKIQLVKLKSLLEDQHARETQLKTRTADRDGLREKIAEINRTLEKNLDMVNSMETRFIENQKKVYGLEVDKNGKEKQIILLTERLKEINVQLTNNLNRETAILERIKSVEESIASKKKEFEEYTSRLAEVEANIGSFEQSIETADNLIKDNEKIIASNEGIIRRSEARQAELQKELRAITEDIVTQLDARLKETGYSYKDRTENEEAIRATLQSLLITVEGKLNILGDAAVLSATPEADLKKLLANAINVLTEVFDGLKRTSERFENYAKAIPSFIDEFLSPKGIITKKRAIDADLEGLHKTVEAKRLESRRLQEENRKLQQKIGDYRKTLEDLRVNRVRMKTQQSSVEDNLKNIIRQKEEQKNLLSENKAETEERQTTLKLTEEKIAVLVTDKKYLEEEEEKLKKEISELQKNIALRNKDLMDKEKGLKNIMAAHDKSQDQLEKTQIQLATTNAEIKAMYDNFRENHSRELSEFESMVYEIKSPLSELKVSASDFKEKQKGLGQVNLMAPEEFAEVKERYEFLLNQIDDLKKAREDLHKITKEIRTETAELFLDTYEKIKKNFHSMFRRLFGGGRAELKLSEPDNVLGTGIEIFAQPPGKKLENIALLSGGERSMTAVGLLFATYMVKPSPFCILDEIDAALDEENVIRFINLLSEFSETSQFIIITHNKKTVAGAKTLIGITMAESGVSKVVTIRIGETVEANAV